MNEGLSARYSKLPKFGDLKQLTTVTLSTEYKSIKVILKNAVACNLKKVMLFGEFQGFSNLISVYVFARKIFGGVDELTQNTGSDRQLIFC